MNELISVIVPVYNVEKYLPQCIDSIINQTYKNIEIILVNDGSTDNSLSICNKYKEKDRRIKIINKKNGGLSSARNAGIEKINGPYLCFIDSDDFIDNNMILKLYNLIRNNNSDIAVCNRFQYYDYKKKNSLIPYSNCKYFNTNNYEKIDAMKQLISLKNFDMSACGKLFKSLLFKDISFPVNKLSEDYFIMYKIFEKCNLVTFTNEPLYYYRQRKGSISKNKKINYDYLDAAKQQMDYIRKNYKSLIIYSNTAYALANMTICNQYINNRNSFPKHNELIQLQNEVNKYMEDINKNNEISKSRKIQANIFVRFPKLYRLLYKLYKK